MANNRWKELRKCSAQPPGPTWQVQFRRYGHFFMLPTLSTRWSAAMSEALPASSSCRLGVRRKDLLADAPHIPASAVAAARVNSNRGASVPLRNLNLSIATEPIARGHEHGRNSPRVR